LNHLIFFDENAFDCPFNPCLNDSRFSGGTNRTRGFDDDVVFDEGGKGDRYANSSD
jgi:hypothetical protein